MKGKIFQILVSVTVVLAIVASFVSGCSCGEQQTAANFMAVIPAILHSSSLESMSVSLFNGDTPVRDKVEVTLLRNGQAIHSVTQTVSGKSTVELTVPDVPEGNYQVNVKAAGFDETAEVTVENSFLVFLETDKPIYKPGQTIHIRVITLDADLRPLEGKVTIEALDAKGIKIFRKEVTTGEFGLASLDLPLSSEPNLGVWKLKAVTEKGETQLDVRVEEYVLPKYEVTVNLAKDWFLVNEEIPGTVTAEYSFGKPVKGELEITASRYVGEWEVYQTYTAPIDGENDFTIDAPGYVAGVPAAGGLGNVMLDITVTEPSTSYIERTSSLVTVTDSSLNIQMIPESMAFKPGLPLGVLIITETPGNEPVDTAVTVIVSFLDENYSQVGSDTQTVQTVNGKAMFDITPPSTSVAMTIEARTNDSKSAANETIELVAAYSPSGNFLHVEQISQGTPAMGEKISFQVYSTREASRFYYEVVSRGRVVFSDYTRNNEITITTSPVMAPSSRLLVYQILPNSEVAADYIPFNVAADYPHSVTAEFSTGEAAPGDTVAVDIQTEGTSLVGIAAVDKSVFILAENRLNLQQVFDELEKLYMTPQVELHSVSIYPAITTRGALDVFDEAGVVVLSNSSIPEGKKYEREVLGGRNKGGIWMVEEVADGMPVPAPQVTVEIPPTAITVEGLAEVQRVRQFFPETWLWQTITTDSKGKASVEVELPDSITTWMLRAVAVSKEKGLGVAEDSLVAFQPFFVTVDLPYSTIRGEEFPISVAVYNYMDSPQEVVVEIGEADWFQLLDDDRKAVTVAADEVSGVDFRIRTKTIGVNEVKITARSTEAADAIIKTIIVEPEGVAREEVENIVLSPGLEREFDLSLPPFVVSDSGRAYLALTGSYLTQTIDGLDSLIQMPFGCGEQNMIVFAPDVYITRYLEESGQLKPEIMAKAEKLMITGYQRQLTYRHSDGSFSAFGESDEIGSLFLTAFVLRSFAEATDLMYIDNAVLNEAADWIISHQNSDGSFDQVGFVHHQEMLGGIQGKDALTAYVTIALLEAGEKTAANKAIRYLEGRLDEIEDVYSLAITACALGRSESGKAGEAYDRLMEIAIDDENGLHWGGSGNGDVRPAVPEEERYYMPEQRTADIEITGYAMMAVNLHGDALNASRAAKWLASQRNAYGGYGSTQDTVIALQALTEYSAGVRADVDLHVTITAGESVTSLNINRENYDVLQIIQLPVNEKVTLEVTGDGEAIAQTVKRYNLPEVETGELTDILKVDVDCDVTSVSVNDLVKVSVNLQFNPPENIEAGMTVLDVSVPTGFTPVTDSIAAVVEADENIKRFETAGRKVIFYIENLLPGDSVKFDFFVKALYPVKAQAVTSQAYSYYQPDIRGETLGEAMTVTE